jgi:UDP-glucose 4-epimerase
MMRQKILVTGAGGYIGSVTTDFLLSCGYHVVAVDNFSTGYRQPLDLLQKKYGREKLTFYNLDITGDISKLFINNKISVVLHFAASCLIDESVGDPGKYFKNNVFGTLNLLETMERFKVNKLVFSSTCAVYGDAKYFPIDERHQTFPESPYGESKLISEKLIAWYGNLKGLDFVIFRYFNVCGALDDGSIGDSKKPSAPLMQNMVRGALGIEPFHATYAPVKTPDKSPIRDFLNVLDLAEAHHLALEYLKSGGKSEIINLGTGLGYSVLEIIGAVQKETGVKFKINKSKPRDGEVSKMVASIKKAKKILGWKPKRTLRDSITTLFEWYEKHPNGWNY